MSGSTSHSPAGEADDLPAYSGSAAPDSLSRLFQEFEPFDPLDREARQLMTCRLLEEGEGEDLRWWVQAVGEVEIAACFERRAGRQISRRSSRFWSLLLSVAAPKIDPVKEALWPL